MQINAFISYADRLIISTSGSILGFSKKPVTQLSAIPEASLLLVLEDSLVHSYDLNTLTYRESFAASKGATLISVFPPPSTDATNNSNGFTNNDALAYNGLLQKNKAHHERESFPFRSSITSRLVAVVELQTPDRAHTLVWLNSNTIAYAHPKRGYFTVTVDTNTITELYKLNASYFSVGSSGASKVGIAVLPKNRLMLIKNDAGVFVNADGSPLIERDLEWSAPPEFITYSAPYVVALIAGSIERVDFFNSQSISLGGDSLIHLSNSNCIWRLLPVSFEDQIEHLIAASQFIEAQRLIEELEFSSEEEKISNIIRVRGLYAHHMFTVEHRYEEAISILSELRASPIDIVNLSEPPVTVALSSLKDYLIHQRQILSKLRKFHLRPSNLLPNQLPLVPSASSPQTTDANTTIAAASLFSGSDHGVPDPMPIPANTLANAEDTVFLSSVALVGSLVRVENFCDLEESEIALKAKNALEYLSSDPDGIVAYLQKLDINLHTDLFIEFRLNIPLKTHLKIVRFFEDKSPTLEVQYLEFLIEELRSEQPEFHERLVLLYLQELVDAMAEMESSPPKTGGRLFGQDMDEGTDTRFLYTRRKLVSPDRIVSLFPDEVSRHSTSTEISALTIRYCEIHYSAQDATARDLFLTLLHHILARNVPQTSLITYLTRYAPFLDALKTIPHLPPTIPLEQLTEFFAKSLQTVHSSTRSSEALVEEHKRWVVVGEDTVCVRCRKKVGAGGVFAVWGDVLVHVYCLAQL
ncbi:hypothetical protein BCR33DRAFT_712932 [Rhizoclosmatium globosum]|uniref:CNH domain-containing protein n=1 Tax=Rhizoclosmatium globosum TaxID=329046 RepID=A0A1Y2CVF3_9FUNG|nr:hypothetical protein BCR33DRAFT_712932 [Rhizoclosmatium globosum]|eukprot:ORY50983.1 hypothetical protein BCR33DRAFT_712932 [Rhizoclosmatium globosum]